MAVRYVETRALLFKKGQVVMSVMREIKTYTRKENLQKEKRAVHEFSSRVPTPPARVPIGRPKETRRSIMPIPAEVVSTARDVTGLLPPWQPQLPE